MNESAVSARGAIRATLIAITVLATAGIASAAGGTSIAAAPTVTLGQLESGDTSCCVSTSNNNQHSEWWKLPLIVGDKVVLDVAYNPVDNGNALNALTAVRVYPVGTTDFNLAAAQPSASEDATYTGFRLGAKTELKFTATRTGLSPLEFYSQSGPALTTTPYQFTAHVTHALVLTAKASLSAHAGRVFVTARTRDGRPIATGSAAVALFERLGKTWRRLAQATATNGTASLRLPASAFRRKTATLRILVTGAAYQPASKTLVVRIPR